MKSDRGTRAVIARGCGYDLRESTGRCPECGREFDASCAASYLRGGGQFLRRRWGRRVAVVFVLLLTPTMLAGLGFRWLKSGWEAEQAQLQAIWDPTARRGLPKNMMLPSYGLRREDRYGWVKGILPAGSQKFTNRVTEVTLFGVAIERIEAAHMEPVAALPHLRSIKLMSGTLASDALGPLAKLKRLESLELSETFEVYDERSRPWTDRHLTGLADLRRLRELHLTVHSVRDAGLGHVGKVSSLETLVLRRNRISGDGLKHLSALTRLKTLDLSYTQVRSETLAHLVALRSLQKLDLSGTPIGIKGVPHLLRLTSLKHLRVQGTRMTEEGMRQLREGLPHVRVVGSEEASAE